MPIIIHNSSICTVYMHFTTLSSHLNLLSLYSNNRLGALPTTSTRKFCCSTYLAKDNL